VTSGNSNSRPPQERFHSLGELEMKYLDWGGDGAAMLALHGLASSSHWYERLAARLHPDYRVVAPDQRGHGKTTKAPTGYDWQTLAADAVALMDRLGMEQAVVLGHSWGGNVAINVAARFPERVSRLVMIDGGFLDGHLLPDASWENFSARFRPRDVSGNREQFLERLRDQLADCWGEDLERVVQTMVYEDEAGMIQDILHPEHHAQVLKAMWEEPPSATLPRIQCPTLIVPAGPRPERAGTEFSQIRERMVEAAGRATPNSRVHWIPDTIHDIGYHKPDDLARVIREFLSEG
jgi:pimeloyl-ACP methyl ester carboxylesterase